ncbi:MAG: hypothetical protein ABWY25_12415 [Paenisporosarcina sp.]
MTVLLLDGCEDFSSWIAVGTAPGLATGRNGSGWTIQGAFATSYHDFTIPTAEQTDTLTFGFAFTTASTAIMPVFDLLSDNGITIHMRCYVQNNGPQFQLGGGTVIFNPSYLFAINTWYYVDFSVKLHDTAGTAAVRVNGIEIGSATGLDTKNAGTKTVFDTVRAKGMGSTLCVIDDLYITNDNIMLGDIRVETLYPNGDGAVNQWVGSDSDSLQNYLLVNEVGAPVLTSFVESSTAGAQDLYTLGDLAAGSGTVRAVCPAAHTIKTDAGARQLKLLVRGSSINASPIRDLGTQPVNRHWGTTINPETGLAWTRAEVNALQAGVEVV